MTSDWILNTLATHIQDGLLVLETYPDGSPSIAVGVDTFVAVFADVKQPTYETLVQADGGKLGYRDYLDRWHAEGLI